jgi:hypothetical protein
MDMDTNKDNADAGTLRQSKEGYASDKLDTVQSEWAPPPSVAQLSRQERIAAETKLKRKIDFRLLPILVIMYILSGFTSHALLIPDYLDRNAIASTRLAGITQDLNLVGDQFQTAVSILFVG